jgi:cyclase
MRRVRVIPTLLVAKEGLVKTVGFGKRTYLGDPINAVKLFNEKEADELIVLDIDAGKSGRGIDFAAVEDIVGEAFMPVAYGGGITTIEDMRRLFAGGVEKVIISSCAHERPEVVAEAALCFGSQSIVASVDCRRRLLRGQRAHVRNGRIDTGRSPVAHALHCVGLGVGELIVTSIDREGTYTGYDLDLLRSVSDQVSVPVVANGGASSIHDLLLAITTGGASAVAAGSLFVYASSGEGVLINYPTPSVLQAKFWSQL